MAIVQEGNGLPSRRFTFNEVTCITKATQPLPSNRSPVTSYITKVIELAPCSPFLKITHSPPDKFRHKPFEYSACSFSTATLLLNCDPNNTPLLVFLAGGGQYHFLYLFQQADPSYNPVLTAKSLGTSSTLNFAGLSSILCMRLGVIHRSAFTSSSENESSSAAFQSNLTHHLNRSLLAS